MLLINLKNKYQFEVTKIDVVMYLPCVEDKLIKFDGTPSNCGRLRYTKLLCGSCTDVVLFRFIFFDLSKLKSSTLCP